MITIQTTPAEDNRPADIGLKDDRVWSDIVVDPTPNAALATLIGLLNADMVDCENNWIRVVND